MVVVGESGRAYCRASLPGRVPGRSSFVLPEVRLCILRPRVLSILLNRDGLFYELFPPH